MIGFVGLRLGQSWFRPRIIRVGVSGTPSTSTTAVSRESFARRDFEGGSPSRWRVRNRPRPLSQRVSGSSAKPSLSRRTNLEESLRPEPGYACFEGAAQKGGGASYKGPGVRLRGTGSIVQWVPKRDRLDCLFIGRFRNAFHASSPDFPNGDLLRRLIP